MCCFSLPVKYVGNTSIYARRDGARQWLAYQMDVETVEEVAMVLPLPVPAGPAEDAVQFHDLSAYPDLFRDLDRAWPQRYHAAPRSAGALSASPVPQTLVVHDVGDFEASFVPTVRDFERLDPRFQLGEEVLANLPQYADWGFAVFQLRQPDAPGLVDRLLGRAASTRRTIHPMAFSFPTRDPSRTFFPTVHVHDGEVPDRAHFDHTLYVQGVDRADPNVWEAEHEPVAGVVDRERTGGLVSDGLCFRAWVQGQRANTDTWV